MICENPPDFAKRGGLVTAIAQDHSTGEILMVAYMNEESFLETLARGEVVYWSTSRNELWHKGESSGNVQILKELRVDCDGDAVLLKVDQKGDAACHTGKRSCFFRKRDGEGWTDDGEQVFDPKEVYGS
ncbi:MAG: phosphoribosyl-AMP cyclohydrolase [Deltaproteobacteria bacterium]|nr:phosphoribosyl-AMP cyclohydrolase [Deltaproteobacteria bacterium]